MGSFTLQDGYSWGLWRWQNATLFPSSCIQSDCKDRCLIRPAEEIPQTSTCSTRRIAIPITNEIAAIPILIVTISPNLRTNGRSFATDM
jgi:hypothetical protein